jgi:acyl carrier protein
MPGAPHSTTASSDLSRSDLESRLIRCFAATFEDLGPEEIRLASSSSLAGWDSMAFITLTMLIEEEFNIRITISDITKLTSFAEMFGFLERTLRPGH